MKKLAIIFLVVFVTALVSSACNRAACPAYSDLDTEQVDSIS